MTKYDVHRLVRARERLSLATLVTHAHGDRFFGAPAVIERESPDQIGRTRRHIEDFTGAAEQGQDFRDLYDATLALYPGRLNRGVLWNSARSWFSRTMCA